MSLIREWSRRLGRSGTALRLDAPGLGRDTPGLAESLPDFYEVMGPILRTPAEGVDTLVWLAAGGGLDAPGGSLWLDRRPRPFDRVPMTRLSREDRRRLWTRDRRICRVRRIRLRMSWCMTETLLRKQTRPGGSAGSAQGMAWIVRLPVLVGRDA